MNFEPGQDVRCVATHGDWHWHFTVGKIYRTKLGLYGVTVCDDSSATWYIHNFPEFATMFVYAHVSDGGPDPEPPAPSPDCTCQDLLKGHLPECPYILAKSAVL